MSQFESQVAERVRQAVLARLPGAMQMASEVELAHLRLAIGFPYPPSGRPQEYPAERTGDLGRSLSRTQEVGSDSVKETLVADTNYAVDLERGHWQYGKFVEPRPLMQLTVKNIVGGEYAKNVAQGLRAGE